MYPFQAQQPDEGYSEDPLSASGSLAVSTKAASGDAGAGLPLAISRHISSLSVSAKIELTEALLQSLPTSAIAQIVEKLSPRLYIDFIRYLPAEICLNILGYLDPLSLIAVARSCRAWYSLSVDRKLWQRLYYLEGWKTIASELQRWEEIVNRDRPVPYEGGGHLSKRRAISSSCRADGDRDHVMLDADRQWRSDMTAVDSVVEDGLTLSPIQTRDTDVPSAVTSFSSTSTSSRKGKQRAVSPGRASATEPASSLPKPTLWAWDPVGDKYRMNWKHLYTLRRRLEANWEQGKYTNFQFPHPDHPEEAHVECIYTIQFNADYLVSGSRDHTIRIWNLHTRRLARRPLVGHRGSVLCLQFDSDPEEDLIVSGSSDSNVILWRFSTGEIIQRLHRAHREPVLNVKFDKNILVTCSKDKTIKVFNRRPLNPGDLGYSPGSDKTAVNPVGINVKRYGYDDINHLPVKPPFTLIGSLEGHSAAVNAVQIYGREIISASGDRNVKIWDWSKQQCIRTLVGHSKGIACVQYDGRRIVSGSSDNEVKVFDRRTSLEVASLCRHSNLVRTVQAGFGDLPYSADEDEKAAARMDQRYLEAVQNGTLSVNPPSSSRHRRRNGGAGNNASHRAHGNDDDEDDDDNGTLRPENIRFTGAKLPPGGGGGQYGRIVSGSYDTTIIIWRRDKRGLWKDQHHLKQEEAAAAAAATVTKNNAQRAARRAANAAADVAAAASQNGHAGAGAQRLTQAALGALQQQQQQQQPPPAHPGSAVHPANVMHVDLPDVGGSSSASAAPRTQATLLHGHPLLAHLIDDLIAQGVHALQQALSTYPNLLDMQSALQAAIDRHPSPFVRSQLRQAVSTAVVREHLSQARTAQQPATTAGPVGAAAAVSTSASAGASSSTQAESGIVPPPVSPATAAAAATGGMPPVTAIAPHTASLSAIQNHQQVAVPPAQPQQAPPAAGAPVTAPHAPHAPHVPQAHAHGPTAAGAAAAAAAAAAVAAGPPPHHPHMPAGDEEANPARVFKLQFDARRIICCSQTAVIVGWDFCNGDPELEEASRFFGTVE
ncbi:hypothetical protein SCUCBS95973_002252 [Sporothrix curviconia]|uniref:F-box domain-containing protein n=1 Tax=Sporothrix curviconia TaxID=1260050 RepID=A0ABP0B5I8_9PEZI